MAGLEARMKAHFNSCVLDVGSHFQEDDQLPKLDTEKVAEITTDTE